MSMYRTMAEGRTVACTSCGFRMEPAAVTLSIRGQIVCSTCDSAERVALYSTDGKAGALALAFGALLLGGIPSVFSAFWGLPRLDPYRSLFALVGVGAALLAIACLRRCARHRRTLATRAIYAWAVGTATLGLLWGGVAAIALEPLPAALAIAGLLGWGVLRR
jgi:hypothetical protein